MWYIRYNELVKCSTIQQLDDNTQRVVCERYPFVLDTGEQIQIKVIAIYRYQFHSHVLHSINDEAALTYYNNNTSLMIEQQWRSYGNMHRDNDKPAYIKYDDDGNISIKIWHQHGMRYRKNNPAYIKIKTINDVSYVVLEEWYWNNKLHREDGPACIQWKVHNNVRHIHKCIWLLNDIQHREDGPAIQFWSDIYPYDLESSTWMQYGLPVKKYIFKNKLVQTFMQYKLGKLHSVDDYPAVIVYTLSGEIKTQKWYKYGVHHRDNGPAIIENDHTMWFCNGKYIRKNTVTKWYTTYIDNCIGKYLGEYAISGIIAQYSV